MYSVRDVMSRDLVTLEESATIENAERLLELSHIRHLPVVRGGVLVGLVTYRDLLKGFLPRGPKMGRPILVREAMTQDVATLSPDSSLLEAIRLMVSNKFGCLPVTTPTGDLVGIVTEADLLRVAADRVEELDLRDLAAEYA